MAALGRGQTLRQIGEITGLSETTLASIRDEERPTRQPDTLAALDHLPPVGSDGKLVDSLPQQELATPQVREIAANGSVIFTGAATIGRIPVFRSEEARVAYAIGVLQAAERYRLSMGVEMELALTALNAPIAKDPAAIALEATEEADLGRRLKREKDARDAGEQTRQAR